MTTRHASTQNMMVFMDDRHSNINKSSSKHSLTSQRINTQEKYRKDNEQYSPDQRVLT